MQWEPEKHCDFRGGRVVVPTALSATQYQFSAPDQILYDGSHLWVANSGGNTVTEVNPSDGSLVRVLSGTSYGFDSPQGMAFDGSHLWVANEDSDSVTEVNTSDGSVVHVRRPAPVGSQQRRRQRHRGQRNGRLAGEGGGCER